MSPELGQASGVAGRAPWARALAWFVFVVELLYAIGLYLAVLAREPLWPRSVQLALVGFPLVGLVVILRGTEDTIAWLMLAIGSSR